jgi:hypothetical protein
MPSDTCPDTKDVPDHIRALGRDASEMYARLRSEGLSLKWCEMVVFRQPPGVKGGDRAFMEGRLNNQQFDRMPKDHAQNIITLASRAGINVSGKYYCSGLADKRGVQDPEAWVDGTGDIMRVAKKRNLSVDGAVTHKGVQEAPQRKALSERLTKELMREERAKHPKMKDGDLRDMVVNKFGRPKK